MSILGPADRSKPKLGGSTMAHLKEWKTEYIEEYSEPQLAAGVPEVRERMQATSSEIASLTGRHTQPHNYGTAKLPPGHPPASAYRHPGDAPVGSTIKSTAPLATLKGSVLYEKEQTWAHWRVEHDGKPQDTRRKYRGAS